MDGSNEAGKPGSGHYEKPVAFGHAVGPQGLGGALKGQTVMGVSNPRGQEAQKLGGGIVMVQGALEPKVGK